MAVSRIPATTQEPSMSVHHHRLARTVAGALAVTALAAPAAVARPAPEDAAVAHPAPAAAVFDSERADAAPVIVYRSDASAPAVATRTVDDGFDWGAAAIGAGAAAAALLLAAGGAGALSRTGHGARPTH
jgi:hypothetical protein